jgi:hypothetical protein
MPLGAETLVHVGFPMPTAWADRFWDRLLDIVLVVPSDWEIARNEMLLERCVEMDIHCFIVRENDQQELADWLHFFGHDRSGNPKGLVEVKL